MPIYEYVCEDCRHEFEELVTGSTKPTCPACESGRLQKQVSSFGVREGNLPPGAEASSALAPFRDMGGMGGGPCGTCGSPDGPGTC